MIFFVVFERLMDNKINANVTRSVKVFRVKVQKPKEGVRVRTEIRKNSVVAKIPRVKQTHLVLYSKRFYVIRIWDIGSDGLETFRVTFIQDKSVHLVSQKLYQIKNYSKIRNDRSNRHLSSKHPIKIKITQNHRT